MIRHQWTGPNGDVFNLSDPAGPVFLGRGEVEGLDFMPTKSYTQESPALSGQMFRGHKQDPRPVFWPLVLAGANWFAEQARFWASLRPGQYGTWRVTAPDGSFRDLACRFEPKPNSYAVDPSLSGVESAGVALVADDPWWKGGEQRQLFSAAPVSPDPFYSPPGATSVFSLLSAYTLDVATMSNPGDVGAWPVWRLYGPLSAFSVGYGAASIGATMTVAAGEYLEIDTNPRAQVVRRYPDGDPVPFSAFSSIGFAEIPPGESVALTLSMSGTGSIEVSFFPRYYRGF